MKTFEQFNSIDTVSVKDGLKYFNYKVGNNIFKTTWYGLDIKIKGVEENYEIDDILIDPDIFDIVKVYKNIKTKLNDWIEWLEEEIEEDYENRIAQIDLIRQVLEKIEEIDFKDLDMFLENEDLGLL